MAVIVTAGVDQDRADGIAKEPERVMVQHFFYESLGRIGYNIWMIPKEMPVDEDVPKKARAIGGAFRARCL